MTLDAQNALDVLSGALAHAAGGESSTRQARALVSDLAERCGADAGVLLAREADDWRVMAVAGGGARGLKAGDLFSIDQNPSLFPDFHAGRPPLPSTLEPFLAALGPLALGDWISCPVVAGGRPVGMLHLLTSWSRPFSSDNVDAAIMAAGVAAPLLGARQTPVPDPERATAAPVLDGLADAVSLLNHDLRSPLNAVLGFAEMLAEGGCDAEQVVRYGQIIAKGAETLQEMVNRLVTHMRILLGVHPWRPERAPVGAFLAGFPARGDLDRVVNWDTAGIADACRALLETATALGGEAAITAEAQGAAVHLTIGTPPHPDAPANHGPGGIPTRFAHQVFAAHDGTMHMAPDGTGFGVRLPAAPAPFDAPAPGA